MTIEDLGRMTKQKYPQYNDVPDSELGGLILKKYPQYKSQLSEGGNLLDRSGLPKNTNIDTTKKKGDSIFKKISNVGDKLLDVFGSMTGLQGTLDYAVGKEKSVKKGLGSTANLALNVATLGGAGTSGNILARVGKSAAIGAGFGAAGAAQKDKSILGGAKTGALLGGALPVVGKVLGGVGKTLTQSAPKQLANLALRVPAKQARSGAAQTFLDKRLGGKGLPEIEGLMQKEVEKFEVPISEALKKSKYTIKTNKFLLDVSNAIKSKTGATFASQELKDRIARFVPDQAGKLNRTTLSANDANLLRRAIDKNLKEATFQGKELTSEQETIKTFANSLRRVIQKGTKTQGLFKEQSKSIRIRNLAAKALDKLETQGRPGLLDVAGAGVGFGLFNLPGVVLGVAGQRLVRSPRFQGWVARVLNGSAPIGEALRAFAPAERMIFLNALLSNPQSK